MKEREVPIYTKNESMVIQALNLQQRIQYFKENLMRGQIVKLTTYKKPTSLVSHFGGVQKVKKNYMVIGIYDNYILCQSLEKTPWKECFTWDQVAKEVYINGLSM